MFCWRKKRFIMIVEEGRVLLNKSILKNYIGDRREEQPKIFTDEHLSLFRWAQLSDLSDIVKGVVIHFYFESEDEWLRWHPRDALALKYMLWKQLIGRSYLVNRYCNIYSSFVLSHRSTLHAPCRVITSMSPECVTCWAQVHIYYFHRSFAP
jgi:hypothetical protein